MEYSEKFFAVIVLLSSAFALEACGVKGPPLPPIPTAAEISDTERTPSPSPSPAPSPRHP